MIRKTDAISHGQLDEKLIVGWVQRRGFEPENRVFKRFIHG